MAAPGYGLTKRLGGAKSSEYSIVTQFKDGYRNREDLTVLPPGVLIPGSQNVLTNTNGRVAIRQGYALDGAENTDAAPIGSAFDWEATNGNERNMRSGFLTSAGNDGKLQYRYVDALGAVTWRDLLTGLTSVDFNYTTFWLTTETLSAMYCVNNTPNLYEWSGGVTTVLSGSSGGGIVNDIHKTPNTLVSPVSDSGGYDYAVDDVLTLTGGDNNAQIKVLSIDAGAVKTSSLSATGANYAPGDIITVATPTSPGHVVCFATLRVDTVGGGGDVLTYTVIKNGLGYTAATSGIATTTNGLGTGVTFHVITVGDGVVTWDFVDGTTHGTGYSAAYYPTTGGAGTNAIVDVFSVASGTITKNGTSTWAEENFYLNRTGQSVTIGGVVYTYTGGADTTILYGVSPDPSGIVADSIAHQTPITIANTGLTTGLPTDFDNALIATLDQHMYIGSLKDSRIWISSINLINQAGSFNPASAWRATRVAFEGSPFQIITTSPPTAFVPQEEFIYISAGLEEWYKVNLNVDLNSANLTTNPVTRPVESVNIIRLSTTAQQAAQTQAVTSKIANKVIFLSHEPIVQTFGRVENNFLTPQMTDLSFTIVNDMNQYDFTNASMAYYRKYVYVAVPAEGLVLMYNMTDVKNPYWEAPQVMPIARFSIIGGLLYGHSSQVSETYQLFTGYADRVTPTSAGAPIAADWVFSYENYGSRFSLKKATKMYVEGYINSNTELTAQLTYELDGCATTKSFTLDGSDDQFVCIAAENGPLGKVSLGKQKLGGNHAAGFNSLPPKFRWFPTFSNTDFFENSVSFHVLGIDERMELLAFGLAVSPSSQIPTDKMD